MDLIYNYSLKELEEYFKSIGQKSFRIKQLYNWLYRTPVTSFEEMTNLAKDLREQLRQDFRIENLEIETKQVAKDGTVKYLFKLEDNNFIEAVLMFHDYGKSLCITSQVGCNMGCKFCASGLLKKVRNLTAGEMVSQVMTVYHDQQEPINRVVIMGTGEPFDNYDNVMKFIRIINDPQGLALGARHITVSTCGLVDKIRAFGDEGIQVNLAVSLHGANDQVRGKLMPINKASNMDDLRKAIVEYIQKTNRRVTFEYIMLKDVNDQLPDARQLAHYLRGLNAYVNLIPYNAVDEQGFQASEGETIREFRNELLRLHIQATIRKEHGQDIDGACGQLRAKKSGVL